MTVTQKTQTITKTQQLANGHNRKSKQQRNRSSNKSQPAPETIASASSAKEPELSAAKPDAQ